MGSVRGGSLGTEGLALGSHSLFYVNGSSTTTHTLYELNPNTGAVIDSDVIDATLLGPIGGLAYLGGKVYAEKYNTNQILVWDPISDTVVTTLYVAADLLGGLTGAADLGLLFDSSSSGSVFTINPATGTVLATFSPGVGSLSGLAYVHGELIAARTGTETAYRIDPVTGAVLGTFTLGATGIVGGLGSDGVTSVSPGAHVVMLVPGQVAMDIDFGNWIAPPGEIHGVKWNDLDGDGVWDQPDEPGLEGWTIFLDTNSNHALDNGETWTTTGPDGSFAFTGLAPGHYVLAEVMQAGWEQTFAPRFITLDAGESVSNTGFGNIALPPLTGDYNRNGVVDAADNVVWRKTLDTPVVRYSGADGNGNGIIDQDDYGIWRAHFGEMLPPPGAGSEAAVAADQSQDLASSNTAAPPIQETTIQATVAVSHDVVEPPRDNLQTALAFGLPSVSRAPRGVGSRPRGNHALSRETQERERWQDEALSAWLSQWRSNVHAADRDAEESVVVDNNALADLSFESFGGKLAGFGDDADHFGLSACQGTRSKTRR